jgi:outer membrane cobalamin receptor
MPLIITNNDSIKSLQVIYDDVNNLYFMADARFSIGERIRVGATTRVNNYTAKNELQAWHLPNLTYAISAHYNLNRKFVFQVGVDGMSRRYNKVLDGPTNLEMKGFADLNCRVDYILKDMVRFWIQGNNLANMKYQTWYGYNNYRLTILGGLAASF